MIAQSLPWWVTITFVAMLVVMALRMIQAWRRRNNPGFNRSEMVVTAGLFAVIVIAGIAVLAM